VNHPALIVVDVRWSPRGSTNVATREFEEGHVPGATFVDLDRDLSGRPFIDGPGRHPLPTPQAFADVMAKRGIDDEIYVVAYDDDRGSVAARLWWMLWITGHQVALLDGGLEAWRAGGGDVETGPARPKERALFTPVAWPTDRVVTASAVETTLRGRAAPVIDARAAERYRGEVEPYDRVAGHVPGAVSIPWMSLQDENGMFLPAEDLRRRFEEAGVTGDATIAYCGSGVTSCLELFAIRHAGFGDARLYEGSWSDWSHDGSRPVATGEEPGELA
jgi:thiosulfate/3-mercaptopyruvate sulfurtransferase